MVNFGLLAAEIGSPVWVPLQISTGFASCQRYCTASSSRRQPNFAVLNRGRHLYSAGRPLRWELAHISSFKSRKKEWRSDGRRKWFVKTNLNDDYNETERSYQWLHLRLWKMNNDEQTYSAFSVFKLGRDDWFTYKFLLGASLLQTLKSISLMPAMLSMRTLVFLTKHFPIHFNQFPSPYYMIQIFLTNFHSWISQRNSCNYS